VTKDVCKTKENVKLYLHSTVQSHALCNFPILTLTKKASKQKCRLYKLRLPLK